MISPRRKKSLEKVTQQQSHDEVQEEHEEVFGDPWSGTDDLHELRMQMREDLGLGADSEVARDADGGFDLDADGLPRDYYRGHG